MKPFKSWFPKLRGSANQKARAAEDKAQRRAAGEHPKSIILTAKDVQGEYDAYRKSQDASTRARLMSQRYFGESRT